jgi:hypothetical protein
VRLWALPGPKQRRGLFAFDPAFAGGVFVG